jgi:hypothetical protein
LCIIASVPAGAQVTKDQLSEMWTRNPDGGGIAYFVNGEIKVEKDMKRESFIETVLETQKKYGNRDILVHMRIATHGAVCIDNTHPFEVNKTTVMAHNGILPEAFIPPAKSELSDTRFFIEYFMKHIPIQQLDDPYFQDMVNDMINQGYGNKLVFLTSAKTKYDTYIIGEELGVWDAGVWFSNNSYESRKFVTYNPRTMGTQMIDGVTISDNCEITPIVDDFDSIESDEINDWLVYHSDLWLQFQEVGVLDHKEMEDSFCVKMTWDGLRCTECSRSVEGIYERLCNSDCKAIEHVIDWVYDNIEASDEMIDAALYSGSLYQGGDPVPETQTTLFDMSTKTKKKSKKKKSNRKSK